MPPKKLAYYLTKITLIDEILGFIYWALAIYGIFFIAGYTKNQIAMIFVLFIYIITVVIFYIFILKRVKRHFKRNVE